MKRNLLIVFLFVLCAASITAADLNIYASGLRAGAMNRSYEVEIEYLLNAPATTLTIEVLNSDQSVALSVPITDSSLRTKGAHSTTIDVSSLAEGSYAWRITAAASANASIAEVTTHTAYKYSFYNPQGVAVDNSYESPYFGRVYVAECMNGASDGGCDITKNQEQGVFIYDAKLDWVADQKNKGYKGNVNWSTTSRNGPRRLVTDAEGNVYICDNGTDDKAGVYVMDPAHPENNFKRLLSLSHHDTPANGGYYYKCNSIVVEGTGEDRVLYMCNYTENISKFDIGNTLENYDGAPTIVVDGLSGTHLIYNGENAMVKDLYGGFWMFPFISTAPSDNRPYIAHFSSSGKLDYKVTKSTNSSLLPTTTAKRGAGSVNLDGTLLAFGANSTVNLYNITWTAGVPSLTKSSITVPSIGGNIDAITFDRVGNLYVCSASSEKLHVFALPKADNTFTTPAPSAQAIVRLADIVDVTGLSLDVTSKTLIKGSSFTLTPTITPVDATYPDVTWESSDQTVATVSNGVVMALKTGTTTITATSVDNESVSATCTVTVELMHGTYNIGGASADFATLADACDALEGSGSISGDVTLQICADITESRNIGLTNNTDYTITIRPDGTTKRTITFNNASDNTGPTGNIMIGCTMAALVSADASAQWASTDTKNIIIDGSYNNDSQQHLEIKGGNVGNNAGDLGVIVVFYGNVTDSEVRNCRLISTRTKNITYVANFRTQQNSDRRPSNVGLKNCYMQVTGSINAQAVYFNGSKSASAAGKPKDCYVKDCEIVSNLRGVFFNGADGAIIEGNTFRFTSASGGFIAHAIMGNAQSGTITVRNNKFIQLATNNTSAGAYGIRAITASGGANVWIIENNYFAGIDALAAGVTSKDFTLEYIYSNDSCVVRHNTFYMPSLTNKPATAISSANPITCVQLVGSKKHHVINNLFYSAETSAANSLIYGAMNENVKNNVYYHAGTNAKIHATSESSEADWEAFEAAGYAEGSVWKQATFTNAANGDLAIAEENNDLKMARLNDVPKDIYGNDRPAQTYAGACEPVAVTNITGVPSTLELDIYDTETLTATIVPANASFKNITWHSDNTDVATVSAAGLVTAVSAGSANITATAGDVTVTCVVTVAAPDALAAGTYRIGGTNPDYASLHAACEDVTTKSIAGDVTFLICADLSETQNCGLVNTTNNSVTIRPDAATKRTITFGSQGDNTGPSGHIMIGYDLSGWTSTDTKNIIIDGSYNGEGQYLEFRAGTQGGRTMVFYGNVTNTEVRNCRIINNRTTGTNYAIELRTAKSTDKHPNGIVIENNYIEVTGTANTQAIVLNGSEESTASGHVANTVIRNNEIASKLRGIFFNKANNATIEGNTFRMPSASGGFLAHAIMGNAQTGTINVRENKFVELKTTNVNAGAYGIRAITASGGATKWVIENNYFGGLDATNANAAGKDILLTYIWCGDLCEIRHNTFRMPSLTKKPSTALDSGDPIACIRITGSQAHVIKNNIFVSEETTANNSLISGTLPSAVTGNIFYHHEGNAALTSSGSAIGDLDASNKWMPIAFTESYKLDFESANNPLIAVTPISGITTDIEGRTRTNPTHAGCYEPSWGLVLNEEADDNTDAIDAKNGITMDVLLKRHFLVEDGMYTLVLPFDLDDAQLQEAFGAGYKLSVMQDAYYKSADVLYLKFGFVNYLEAGLPCLLQVGADVTEDILFRDVTIDNSQPINDQGDVQMIGLYDMTEVAADVRNYYLGSGDYLFQYKTDIQTKGFRSYFHFPGFATSAPPRVARVIFHEEVATDDMLLESTPATAEPEKIIRDGEILIIVNGVEYDMMGRPRVK